MEPFLAQAQNFSERELCETMGGLNPVHSNGDYTTECSGARSERNKIPIRNLDVQSSAEGYPSAVVCCLKRKKSIQSQMTILDLQTAVPNVGIAKYKNYCINSVYGFITL